MISSKIKEGKIKNPFLVVSLVLLLCFAFGCQNKAEKAELQKFRAQAKVEEQNKELFRKAVEAINERNFEYLLNEVMAPDYGYFYPSSNPKSISREEVIAELKMFEESFPDFSFTIVESAAVGDMVISRYTFRGTHNGTFQGIPATGNKVEFSDMNWCHITDGKIVTEREEYDMLGFMEQLGMEIKPREVKK